MASEAGPSKTQKTADNAQKNEDKDDDSALMPPPAVPEADTGESIFSEKKKGEEGEIVDRDELLRQKRLYVREKCQMALLDRRFLTHLSEMHPTSALHELCTKLNFAPPNLAIAFECGPPLFRHYIFKATVNGQTYQPVVAVDNKKDAKANAAWFALQEMGFINKDPANPL